MGRKNYISRRQKEKGVIITLVAVFMLFVVGAMAALSIDVVTIYTARSEAQLVADSAALAAARVLANSGATSDATLMPAAQLLAVAVATQVAQNSMVGGRYLASSEVVVTFSATAATNNPRVTVSAQRSDLPTFFARIWGRTQVAVAASATAEAYNPTPGASTSAGSNPPVAPLCVKPWLLPNMDPSNGGAQIFDPTTGAVNPSSNLLGWSFSAPTGVPMRLRCLGGNCTSLPSPSTWHYYPGNDDPTSFPHPTSALPSCSQIPTPTNYEDSIIGCVQTPLACNSSLVNIDASDDSTRNTETADAVNCLTHSERNNGDTVTTTEPPNAPFEFVGGADNPIPGTAGNDEMVSDSLVTLPVFNSTVGVSPTNPVQIIGFVQLFLNPNGIATPADGHVNTTVINLAGCGTSATGQPIFGNGASPVAVRLVTGS